MYTPKPVVNNSAPVEQVLNVSMVVPLDLLQEQPADIDCPFCQQMAKTSVMELNSGSTGYAHFRPSISLQ